MKTNIILAILISLLFSGCTATIPIQTKATPEPPEQTKITRADIASILKYAIQDIESKSCKPLFLAEKGPGIWCWCVEDGGTDIADPPTGVKYYDITPILQKYVEAKEKEKSQ